MANSAEFLSERLLAAGVAISFASSLTQIEMFTGSCGLYPSTFHLILIGACICGMVLSTRAIMTPIVLNRPSKYILCGMALVYACTHYILNGGYLIHADKLLIEAAIIFALPKSGYLRKAFITRVLIGVALSRFLDPNCDGSWYRFASLKTDALNQPFPFTPVWHLAQIPDAIVRMISALIIGTELIAPIVLLLARPESPLESAASMTILSLSMLFYGLIGNFNWCALIIVAMCVSLIHPSILTLVLGDQAFVRWGFDDDIEFNESESETQLIKTIGSWAVIGFGICAFVGCIAIGFDYNIHKLLSMIPLALVGPAVTGTIVSFGVISCLRESGTKFILPITVLLGGLAMNGSTFTHILTNGWVPFENDYSGLPTCYTFNQLEGFPVHSGSGRASFLFQTKYSVIGTNTVGSNLGGTRYAELSIPGSVHADEQRPPFLIGHLPRLALKLWKTGTGNLDDIKTGLELIETLSNVIRNGGRALEVFFPDTDPKIIEALSSSGKKKNDVRAFYQSYGVTSRAADHQWWKRDYENVSALPDYPGVSARINPKCSPVIPAKLLGYNLDMILITGMLGLVLLRILLSNPKRKDKK
jgi:hypothetical protein